MIPLNGKLVRSFDELSFSFKMDYEAESNIYRILLPRILPWFSQIRE